MPTYCFTNVKTKQTVERQFPMGATPRRIQVKGKLFLRDIPTEWRDRKATPGNWPMVSDFGGVHPDQIPEATEFLAKRGVSVEFLPNGDVVHSDRANRKQYHEAMGKVDLDGGYRDATTIIKDTGD